jgi:hypothetical protein
VATGISSNGEYSNMFISNHLKSGPMQCHGMIWCRQRRSVDHSVLFGSAIFFQRLATPSPSM